MILVDAQASRWIAPPRNVPELSRVAFTAVDPRLVTVTLRKDGLPASHSFLKLVAVR